MDPQCKSSWKIFIADKLEKWGYSNIWQLRREGLSTAMQVFNNFWQSVMQAWSEIMQHPTTAPSEILSQPLWHNNEILINKQRVCKSHWIKKGIFFINDLINDDGNFLSLENFQDKFNVHTNFFTYNVLISAIQKTLERIDKECPERRNI